MFVGRYRYNRKPNIDSAIKLYSKLQKRGSILFTLSLLISGIKFVCVCACVPATLIINTNPESVQLGCLQKYVRENMEHI
jgi:hypothetical protein